MMLNCDFIIPFQFHLGDDWNDAVAWLNRVACSEDDLNWGEEWLVRRPSQIESLHRLIQMLYKKTKVVPITGTIAN